MPDNCYFCDEPAVDLLPVCREHADNLKIMFMTQESHRVAREERERKQREGQGCQDD